MAQMHRDDKGKAKPLNNIQIEELAYSAVIKELRRGNGRVGLAVLEALGRLVPQREQSTTLTSTIATLLPGSDSNGTMNEPSKQPRSPGGDGDNTDSSAKFSPSGLTPPTQTTDSDEVSEKEGE